MYTFVCLLRNNIIIVVLVSCLDCLLHFTVAAYDRSIVTDHHACKIAQVKENEKIIPVCLQHDGMNSGLKLYIGHLVSINVNC